MEFKTAKKWLVPYGTWIILSHSEACDLTSGISRASIEALISGIGTVYAAIAAIAIDIQARYIRDKNEQSGGKGVKLLFVWALGVITSINRLGSGSSPCSSTSGGSSGGGGSAGGGGFAGGGGRVGPGGPIRPR